MSQQRQPVLFRLAESNPHFSPEAMAGEWSLYLNTSPPFRGRTAHRADRACCRSRSQLDLPVLLAHFVGGERLGCGSVEDGAARDIELRSVALALERGAGEETGGEGAGHLATLLATPSNLRDSQNAKTPPGRVFADGPAWIRTRDQRIMSPLL